MYVLIAYDTPSNRRRAKISRILCDYGRRIQYSVFDADLSDAVRGELLARLRRAVDETVDQVRVLPICRRCLEQARLLGPTEPRDDPDADLIL